MPAFYFSPSVHTHCTCLFLPNSSRRDHRCSRIPGNTLDIFVCFGFYTSQNSLSLGFFLLVKYPPMQSRKIVGSLLKKSICFLKVKNAALTGQHFVYIIIAHLAHHGQHKTGLHIPQARVTSGTPGRNRTYGQPLRRRLLYPLSYRRM